MKELFDSVSVRCSQVVTKAYSTSFSLGIRFFSKELRDPIYSIYGFVRFADEIVDTFHNYDKAELLKQFKDDTFEAIDQKISLNPILNSFQFTVNKYQIEPDLIIQFLKSMEMDLTEKDHNPESVKNYIVGSAEVVGLMCLRVFCDGNKDLYEQLKPYAMRLGAAFQKINFLRDIKVDYIDMGRNYFPEIELSRLTKQNKLTIEKSIATDFEQGFKGIKMLPRSAKFGVYITFVYYRALFRKIKKTPPEHVMNQRVRIHNRKKAILLAYSYIRHQLNLI